MKGKLVKLMLCLSCVVCITGCKTKEEIRELENNATVEILEDLEDKYDKEFKVVDTTLGYSEGGHTSVGVTVACVDDGIKFKASEFGYDNYGAQYYKDEIEESLEDYLQSVADNYSTIEFKGLSNFNDAIERCQSKSNFFEMTSTERMNEVLGVGVRIVIMPSSSASKVDFHEEIQEFLESIKGSHYHKLVNTKGELRYELIYDTTAYEPKDDWLDLWFKD